jgi:hypothetical protein
MSTAISCLPEKQLAHWSYHYHHLITITSSPSPHHHHLITITSSPLPHHHYHHHHLITITSSPPPHSHVGWQKLAKPCVFFFYF